MSITDGDFTQVAAASAGSVGLLSLISLAVVTFLRSRPELKKIQSDGDQAMRDDLFDRIRSLEARVENLQEKLEGERKAHEAEMSIMRHRLNNETHTLDILLIMIKAAPDKLEENLDLIIKQREEQKKNIAVERAGINAVKVGVEDDAK